MATAFDPLDPEFIRDPYPTYAALRSEAAVARVRIGVWRIAKMILRIIAQQHRKGNARLGASLRFVLQRLTAQRRPAGRAATAPPRPGLRSRLYCVSRFDEASHVLRHPEIFSSEIMGGSQPEVMNIEGDIAPTSGALIAHDPPEHTRQRNIVNRGFTPRRIAALEPKVRKNAEDLFAQFEHRGHCDLMEEFANPLPVSVIADLLGLDPARRADFKRWSTALIVGSTRPAGDGFGANLELFREFRRYMTQVIEERRKDPGDDLISTLIRGSGEDAEQSILDPEQLISFATLLLAAGSETTTNLIGNAMLALFRHPEQLALVRREPARIPAVVEEALRYDAPIQLTARLAVQSSEVSGVSIPKGSIVAVLLASANRDETHFAAPEQFDITRPTPSHLAFGFGNHFCIGASLARVEAAIALEMILGRLTGLALVSDGEVPRHGSFLVRGPSELLVRWNANTTGR